MPIDFCVTLMTNVSDPFYDGLNKTNDFWTKLSPTTKFNGKCKVALTDCIFKNKYNILRKDHRYGIIVRPHDWPLVTDEWIKSITSAEYPFVTLPYKEYGSVKHLCRAVTRRISARKMVSFDNLINHNLRDVLHFKQNIINGRKAGITSGIERVILQTIHPASHLTIVYFFMQPFSRCWESVIPMFPSCVFLNEKQLTNKFQQTLHIQKSVN